MGGRKTLAVVLAVAAICALALSACGGGDDSTATTAASTAETTQAEAPTTPAKTGDKGLKGPKKPSKKSSGSKKSGGAPTSAGGGDPNGGPEPASNFETPGGDNSIQEYGEEGEEAEREEATVVVDALFKAMKSGSWNEVCSKYLSKSNVEQLELLGEKVPQAKGKDCAGILGGLNAHTGSSPGEPAGGVGAVRTEGEVSFAIYRGTDGKGYAIPMKREGGGFKLTALAPTPLSGP